MPKFIDSPGDIPAGQPANLCVEKETLMSRTYVFTESCKKHRIQSGGFYKIHNFNDVVQAWQKAFAPLSATNKTNAYSDSKPNILWSTKQKLISRESEVICWILMQKRRERWMVGSVIYFIGEIDMLFYIITNYDSPRKKRKKKHCETQLYGLGFSFPC